MGYQYKRTYRGPVQLVIFDWAGTTVDYGCQAPIDAFLKVFKANGAEVSIQAARDPMGMEKKEHIRAVAAMEKVSRAWQKRHGREVTEADIETMYEDFVRLLLKQLAEKSTLIPGVAEAISVLREQGIKIGASTGYFTEAAEIVSKCAAPHGYVPDFSLCASDVPAGRPAPWMIFRIMENLQVYPPEAVVNVGDTPVDVESGLNAGVWSIGVAATGNQMGLTEQEAADLTPELYRKKLYKARSSLAQAGAHWVIDTMEALPQVLEKINRSITLGAKP